MRRIDWIKQKGWAFCLSILLPMGVMCFVYFLLGIYPGSEKTILASDALSQTSNFFASLNNVLHGKQSFFYTWYGSLGLNYWSFMAYYLNGIFSPLIYFFDNSQVPDALYMIILLKFGTIGGTFWIMSDQTFKVPQWINVMLSISYALSGFAVAYSPQQMWLDGLIYLPLVILGIHRLMDKSKPAVLFSSYLLLFLSNFYMAFMIGVFSFLYVFCRFLTEPAKYKKSLLPYFITSLLAGGASMITILPTLLDLKNNGESLTELKHFFTSGTDIWDIPVKTMVGVYDTSKFGSSPFLYFGLIGLIFCLFYFVSPKFPLKNKLLYGSLFLLLIASVYIEPLNLFWHGFHSPNMFLFRFSFLFSFLGLLLAGFGLENVTKEDTNRLVNIVMGMILLYIAIIFLANRKRYDYLDKTAIAMTVVLLLVYLTIWIISVKWYKKKMVLWVLLFIVFLGEMMMNTQQMITGINGEWRYPERVAYDRNYQDVHKLVESTRQDNDTLYRLANLNSVSRNESFIYGYSGVSMFSSIRNRHSSMYLDELGFRSNGTNLTIQYANNTLVMDALLGIKYNISENDPKKYGFTLKETAGKHKLYENRLALPLGILTDQGIYKKNAVKNQAELIQYLSNQKEPLFYFSEAEMIKEENVQIEDKGSVLFYSKTVPNKLRKITYSIDVPARSQAYLSLYGRGMEVEAITKVNGIEQRSGLEENGQYYNLGYYEKAEKIQVEVSFTGEGVVHLVKPTAMFMNVDVFEKSVQSIQKQGVSFETKGRIAQADVALEKEQVVLTTIPYDKGWSAYIDGKKVEIPTFKDAFLALPVPEGKHKIKFVFLPEGFKIGLSLFISCTITFVFYNWWIGKRRI
ncbi:YfhO family protein [Enterococcus ureasiticus]|uniref:Copper ABC transporter permease n=1 Tax=Enterococcus ureasiticus TaxID=903984 RepID=A0A1E5GN71_9ENTE|nr:YfhO family protein [Enterococcus ureasiticus]OEG14143.1 copper ABC transporter permease [Enterococcus ureasiticus]